MCYPIENNRTSEESFDFKNQNQEENSDSDPFSQPVVSLTPKNNVTKTKKHEINLNISTQNFPDHSINQVEITENQCSYVEKLTDTGNFFKKSSIDENYLKEVNKDIPECTLLARLHDESCNTNLDPNLTKSSSSNYLSNNSADLFSKTFSDDTNMNFIRDLHQESFHTNLDPYTNIQSQFDKTHEPRVSNNLDSYTIGVSQSDFVRKSECLYKLHEPSTLNNLEQSELSMTGETFYDDMTFQQSDPVVNITPRNPIFRDNSIYKKTFPNRTSDVNKPWTKSASMNTEEKLHSLDQNMFFNSCSSSYEISQPVCSNFNNKKRDNVNKNNNNVNNNSGNSKEEKNQKPSRKLLLDDSFWEN